MKIVKLPPEDPQDVRDRDLPDYLREGPRRRPGAFKYLENNQLTPEQVASYEYKRS